MGFWRLALFERGIRIVWSVNVCRVIVTVIVWFIINIITISVTATGGRRATIQMLSIETTFIRAVAKRPFGVRMASIGVTVGFTVPPRVVRTIVSVIIGIVIRRKKMILRFSGSFLQDGPDRFVFSEWHSDPAVVVVYAGPLSRLQSSGVYVHQGLFISDHLVQLLQFSLLPRQLTVHDSASSGWRARFPPPLATVLTLSAGFTPLLGPVFAPAATPAGAPASAATPAATLRAASGAPVRPFSASSVLAALALGAGATSPFHDTSKLVSGWTPTFTPTPATTIFTPSDVILPQIFHHRLQLVRF